MLSTIFPTQRDRRGAPRSAASLSAYLITPAGNHLRGIAKNLSRSGVFVEARVTDEWLVGETARLVFALSDGNVIRLTRYSVLIVREAGHGLGVAFWRSMRSAQIHAGS